jgi:1,4-dihydroxy-2-naphthoate octaprenyltransferase
MALKDYVLALRPWSLSASLIPVTLGAVLSYKCHENFHPVLYLVTVGSVLAVHGAGNAVNTFYDFEKGVDTQQSDDRTLVDHRLKPGDVVSLGMYLYLLAMLCLWLVIWLSTAKAQIIALLFFCGLSGSFMYTGGIGLKYYALGDFIIIVAFGPLAVLFSFTVQAGHIHLTPLVLAVPLALHTEAALHCNNARDLVTDKRVGVVTLAILCGKQGSYFLYVFFLLFPYLVYFLWGMWYSGWLGLPCLTIFFSFHLERQFREGKLRHLPKETAKLNTISAILFVCGCVMSKSTSIPFLQCYNSG